MSKANVTTFLKDLMTGPDANIEPLARLQTLKAQVLAEASEGEAEAAELSLNEEQKVGTT
jgi:hypothetical protein